MPWNGHWSDLLTAKDLSVGRVGKNGPIGPKCYQFATKINRAERGLSRGGSAQFLLSFPTLVSLMARLSTLDTMDIENSGDSYFHH
jgi:hypothetical protein